MRKDLIARGPELTVDGCLPNPSIGTISGARLREWAEDERIIREVALFAERSDITEELIRLRSHLKQMRVIRVRKNPLVDLLIFFAKSVSRN